MRTGDRLPLRATTSSAGIRWKEHSECHEVQSGYFGKRSRYAIGFGIHARLSRKCERDGRSVGKPTI
jgi:hypothetical protein